MGVNDTINMNCQKPSDQKSPTLGVLRMLINNYSPLRAMLVASPANATKSDEFCLTNMLKAAEVSAELLTPSAALADCPLTRRNRQDGRSRSRTSSSSCRAMSILSSRCSTRIRVCTATVSHAFLATLVHSPC